MSGGHGGRRAGAGRKPGTVTAKTREIADRASQEGITPLEVMLKAMRLHAEGERWDQAAMIAKDAAPYMHPRLATVTVGNKPGETFCVEHANARNDLLGRLAGMRARREIEGTASELH
jgi:hypothetical protein